MDNLQLVGIGQALLESLWPVLVTFVACTICRCSAVLRTPVGFMITGAAISLSIFRLETVWIYTNALVVLAAVKLIEQLPVGKCREAGYQFLMVTMVLGFITNSVITLPCHNFIPVLGMIQFLKYLIFVWESATGRVSAMPVLSFMAWAGLPFNIVLWPSDFSNQLNKGSIIPMPIGISFLNDCLIRVFMLLIAWLSNRVGEWMPPEESIFYRFCHIYAWAPWGWYLQAAAVAGLMRNAGALAGIAVPENFRSPFLATNISDFWSRWNIGATHAFRDMLFFNRFGFSFYNPYLNTMIVFLAMGAWHAINPYWLLFGLIHGVGFCCYIALGSRLDWSANRKLRLLGWACTYCFVCSCWALPPQLMKLGRALSATLGVS